VGANEAASAAAAAAKTARDAEAASAAAAKTARDAEAITAAAMAAAEAAAEAAAAAAAAAVAGGTPAAAVSANTAAAQWSGHNIHIKRQPPAPWQRVQSMQPPAVYNWAHAPAAWPQGMPSSDAPIADHYQFTPGPYEY